MVTIEGTIAWVFNIKAESVVLYVFIKHIEHELSAVGTVDGRMLFPIWI